MSDEHERPIPSSPSSPAPAGPPAPQPASAPAPSSGPVGGPDSTAVDGTPVPTSADGRRSSDASTPNEGAASNHSAKPPPKKRSALTTIGHVLREVVIVVVVALVASALLRAFVVQAFFVPSGSMLPEIQLHDRILVSRIGDIDRGEVVVFEDPGDWIPANEEAAPPTGIRKGLEWIGVLPASGHEHLVKRVIGMPGDHVVCCKNGKLVINGVEVDESDFLFQGAKRADNYSFDVVVPADHIFVLGDHRYVSGDSSRRLTCTDPNAGFVPMDLVTGRAFAVVWPRQNIHKLGVPDAYDDVPPGQDPPPETGVVTSVQGEKCANAEAP